MYLLRANNKYNTTLYQAAHVGDTTIYVNAVASNLPSEVTLDYGLSTEETVTVVSSGTNSLTLQSGQSLAYAHSVGGSVQCLDQADYINIFAGYFEQDHDQGGYHHIANFGLSDYVISGITIPTSAGLSATSTSGFAYITGKRISVASDGGHTYTASQDTYVDVDNTGTYHYNGVSNGASAPSLTANSIRVAKVITSGSAITTVVQFGADSNGVLIYPSVPYQNLVSVRNISQFGLSDYIVSGLTIPTSAGLSSTSVSGVAYIKGFRINIASDGGHTYTASQDTYVDVDWNGVYHYSGVSNGASSPALTANSIRIAKVISSGSAITSVVTDFLDTNETIIYPTNPNFVAYREYLRRKQYTCRAYASTTQSVPTGTGTLMQINTVDYDPNSNFTNTSTYKYTAPVSGKYQVNMKLYASLNNSGKTFGISVFKNGAGIDGIYTSLNAGDGISLTYADQLKLSAGDYIQMYAYQDSGGSLNMGSPSTTNDVTCMSFGFISS